MMALRRLPNGSVFGLLEADRCVPASFTGVRGGKAPQDLLIEELDPLSGAQTLVDYRPTHDFQWQDGTPDGFTPPGGHQSAIGMTGFMVRSVTVKPFSGRSTRATAIGYDYKDPYFDPTDRTFRGFGRTTITPLDPATGSKLKTAPSVVIYESQQSHGRGGVILERTLDGDGVPVSEMLYGYTDVQSVSGLAATTGVTTTYFSAHNDTISVEYPTVGMAPAILDFGFDDGRRPFTNRVDRAIPQMPPGYQMESPRDFAIEENTATGGGLHFGDPDERRQLVIRDPKFSLTSLPHFTLEAWIKQSTQTERQVIVQNSHSDELGHSDGYELAIEASGKVSFAVLVDGDRQEWDRVTGGKINLDTWTHIAASFDHEDDFRNRLRLFVNGVLVDAQTDNLAFHPNYGDDLEIGSGGVRLFDGTIGELRIYPSAWQSPPRITESRTVYEMTLQETDFGMPLETWDSGDVVDPNDDVVETVTYATPQAGSRVRNAMATRERRVLLGPGSTPGSIIKGDYLGYAETYYDGLGIVGLVKTGNVTKQAIYGGPVPLQTTTPPTPEVVTLIQYTNTDCPGVATDTIDPLGAVTRTSYDRTCTFPVTVTNHLGHQAVSKYYGVDSGIGTGAYTNNSMLFDNRPIGGRYGQIAETTDPNGARTVSGYDEWGRPTVAFGPYDPNGRPSSIIFYQDPIFDNGRVLTTPAVVKTQTWDDMQHRYVVTYAFGDGQVQAETLNQAGTADWTISGTQDFDKLGRISVTYKPRFMSQAVTTNGNRCVEPTAGEATWCNFQTLASTGSPMEINKNDPLRDPAGVAHVQTAYDNRGRVIRVYGPDVPACDDPSATNSASGRLLCNSVANAPILQPPGHYTSYEYPELGVVRAIDARGVPSVSRHDVQGRLRRTEEYMKTSRVPYSTADYTYDHNGNVTRVEDSVGNVTTASYDALGHKLTSNDPDMGAWKYTYDDRGQLLTQTDARGNVTGNEYDPLGRVTRTEYLPSVLAKQYTFDGGSNDAQLTDPLYIFTGGDGSAQWHTVPAPDSTNSVLLLDATGAARSFSVAHLSVDLSGAVDAELAFRSAWLTRCVATPASCNLDRMSVDYYALSAPAGDVELIGQATLTGMKPVSDADALRNPDNMPVLRIRLPAEALGRDSVLVKFVFDSVEDVPPGVVSGWAIDDIRVYKTMRSQPEDVVEHNYNSAELASGYTSSLLDLTFDVPGRVTDRSDLQLAVNVIGTRPAEGVSGRGIEFSGADLLQVPSEDPDSPPFPPFPPFPWALTVVTWVKPSDQPASGDQYLVSKLSLEGEFYLLLDESGALVCRVTADGYRQVVESEVHLPTDTWTHVAMTYDGSELRCYINGIPQSDAWREPGSVHGEYGTWLTIGGISNEGFSQPSFRGLLDEVRVFLWTLSPDEVLATALSPLRHGPPRGNVLDLTFSDPATPFTDVSGANNPAREVPRGPYEPAVEPVYQMPGIEGTALRFIGKPIMVDNKPSSFASEELTAEIWVNTEDAGGQLLMGKWDNGYQEPGWRLVLDEVNPGHVRFEVQAKGPGLGATTTAAFVTLRTINDEKWHHVTGTYNGQRIQVYIDGEPALRICTNAAGQEIDCAGVPPEPCQLDQPELAVCVKGSIVNDLPVLIGGSISNNVHGLWGMLDEVRISNYAKRDFEVAASARPYREFAQALGREVEMRNGAADDTGSYDLLGRAVAAQRLTHLNDQTSLSQDGLFLVRTAFDNLGREGSLRYPDGEVVVSSYDRGGIQTQLIGYGDLPNDPNVPGTKFGKQPYLLSAGATVTGRIAQLGFGNRVQTMFIYDEGHTKNPDTQKANTNGTFGNELLSELVTVLPSGEVLQDQSYTYDPMGNLLIRKDYARPASGTQPGSGRPPEQHSNALAATYTYDDLSRLKSFEVLLGGAGGYNNTYDYDQIGNLIDIGGTKLEYGTQRGTASCSFDASARPAHAVTLKTITFDNRDLVTWYCYDANGALAERRGSTMAFDWYKHNVPGKLAELTNWGETFRFTYDGNGVRVHKVEPSGVTVEPFPFYRMTGNGVEKYYFAAGRRIARRTGPEPSSVFWYHPEHLGSTNLMTGVNGDELQDAYSEYEPYGRALPTAGNNTAGAQYQQDTPNSDHSGGFQFTGKELDATGLYDYGARYYDPVIGRFIEPDDITPDSRPQSLNRYSYVLNNPLIYNDPTGHEPCIDECVFSVGEEIIVPRSAPPLAAADQATGPVQIADFSNEVDVITARKWIVLPVSITSETARWPAANLNVVLAMGKIVTTAGQAAGYYQLAPNLHSMVKFGTESAVNIGARVFNPANVRVTNKGIQLIEAHLTKLGARLDPPNAAMIARLRSGNLGKPELSFYVHEIKEAELMGLGLEARAAHLETLRWQNIPYKPGYEKYLYNPDVVFSHPEFFSPATHPSFGGGVP